MENTDQKSYNHFYAMGFFKGFCLSATNPAVAMQMLDIAEMESPFLVGVAAGIKQQMQKTKDDADDFTRS